MILSPKYSAIWRLNRQKNTVGIASVSRWFRAGAILGRHLPQKSNFASLKEYSFKVKKRSFCIIKISMLTLKICKFLKHDHVVLNATDITHTFEHSRVRTSKVGELLMSPLSPFCQL